MARSALPTVSAVLIVKDEETVLDACLASVAWCDEIVVYDTGSTDGTVEIARRHTDVVIEGYWDDDFGGARNRALGHAVGDWALIIDADEVFHGDPTAIRKRLGRGGATIHTIDVEDVRPLSVGPVDLTVSVRFMRRDVHQYLGQLHEQVVAKPGRAALARQAAMPNVRLVHSGYRPDVVESKGKTARNLEMAERDLAEALAAGATGVADLRANLARSTVLAGRPQAGLELAEEAYRSGDMASVASVQLARAMSGVAHELGQVAACETWLKRWADAAVNPVWAHARRAQFAADRGDAEGTLEALERVPTTTVNEFKQRLNRAELASIEVWALDATGRARRAADVALAAARSGELPGAPHLLAGVFERAGRDLDELLGLLSPAAWSTSALLASQEASTDSLAFLGEMCRVRPGDVTTLTCAASLGARMTIEQAMDWSVLLRRAGLVELCPLRVIAGSTALEPRHRATAAAIAFGAYGDHSVLADLADALASVPQEHEQELARLLDQLAPGLLAPVS